MKIGPVFQVEYTRISERAGHIAVKHAETMDHLFPFGRIGKIIPAEMLESRHEG
jgi:hypothetical protein